MNNINNQQDWDRMLDQFPEANFLQSWEWGEFNQNLGNKIYRVAIPNLSASKGLTSQAFWAGFKVGPCKIPGLFLAIVENAKRGRYLTIPSGPLLGKWNNDSFRQAVLLMKEIVQKENCSFIRIRPQVMDTPRNREVIRQFGFRPAPMHLHAELTRVLDLTKSDEELLKEMRKTTRYEIRKALKMRIKVYQGDDEKLIDAFIRLQTETASREHFVPFSRRYLSEQFRAFKPANAVRWFYTTAPQKDEILPQLEGSHPSILSMVFVIFYRNEAVYHYAASSEAARKIPAAYVIQWAIIQEARKRGCKTYNLWGDVADDLLKKHRFSTHQLAHRFAGPSLFKRGFGGKQIAYLHAHDLPLNWKYWIDWGIETVRKNFRKL